MALYGSNGIQGILGYLKTYLTQKLGLKADSVHTHTKSQITDFPQTMPPSAHTHAKSDVTGLVDDLSNLSEGIPVFEDISSKCAIDPNQVAGSVTNIKAFRYGNIVTIRFNIKNTFDFTVRSAIVVNDLMDMYPILPSDNTLPYDVLTKGNTDTTRQALQNFAVSIWPTSLTAFSVKISQHNPSIAIPDGTTCIITYMGGPYSIVG